MRSLNGAYLDPKEGGKKIQMHFMLRGAAILQQIHVEKTGLGTATVVTVVHTQN